MGLALFMAERAGFEPALGYYPKHAFQACDLNHSSTSPWKPRILAVSVRQWKRFVSFSVAPELCHGPMD